MKKSTILIFSFLFCLSSFAQSDITNTLGTGGVFSIKDGSTTFLSINQQNGYLNLTSGVIFKGANQFIHDFAPTGAPGYNTFVGISAGNFTMSHISGDDASFNTGVGHVSLLNLTTGYFNTALGYSSLVSNREGYYNTALGAYSLGANTTGYNNTATGYRSLYWNTTGVGNAASGFESLFSNTDGYDNTAVGFNSLHSNTTGNYNTALGSHALNLSQNGSFNTAVGFNSLHSNNTGDENTAVGSSALALNTDGIQNTAVGMYALVLNGGNYNTALGYNSLSTNIFGFQNTAVGHHSLQHNTGNYNTALGYNAGSNVSTGENLTLIGIDANPSTGYAINQITLGNAFVTSLRCNVTTITSLSDARDKRNIKELNLGIDFLMKIKPRQFNWDRREWYADNKSDGSKMKEEPTAGFIAQELDEVQTTENAEWLNLVLKDNPEKLEATPGNLLPIIVKAIQDLKKENDELKARLTKFEQMENVLSTKIEKLEANSNETTKVSLGDQ